MQVLLFPPLWAWEVTCSLQCRRMAVLCVLGNQLILIVCMVNNTNCIYFLCKGLSLTKSALGHKRIVCASAGSGPFLLCYFYKCDKMRHICLVSALSLTQSSYNLFHFLSDRDTRTIFCSNVRSLTLVPATGRLRPLGSPEWRVSCMLLNDWWLGPLDSFKMGTGHQKDPLWLGAWNFQPHPHPQGREVGLQVD